MNGASAALMISDIPCPMPVGAVRIGKVDGNFVVNPNEEDLLDDTDLDLVVAGTEEAILMVEAGRQRDPRGRDPRRARHRARRDQEAVRAAARAAREGRQAEDRDRAAAGRRGPARADPRLARRRSSTRRPRSFDKLERQDATKAVEEAGPRRSTPATREAEDHAEYRAKPRSSAFDQAREADHPPAHRRQKKRPDGRAEDEIRPISIEAGVAPAHARLGAVHARPDAGALGRRAGHAQGGDAPRHPRARDQEVLLPPLQLPAVLGRARRASCAAPSAVTSATARSPSARSCR